MARDKMFRMPMDLWGQLWNKKMAFQNRIKLNTGRTVNIPMTDVLRFYCKKKLFVWDDEVLNFFLAKKRRRSKMVGEAI